MEVKLIDSRSFAKLPRWIGGLLVEVGVEVGVFREMVQVEMDGVGGGGFREDDRNRN